MPRIIRAVFDWDERTMMPVGGTKDRERQLTYLAALRHSYMSSDDYLSLLESLSNYETYLGVRPSHDSEGILQDVHWYSGAFGYFPSYLLRAIYSAQLMAKIERDLDDIWKDEDVKFIASST